MAPRVVFTYRREKLRDEGGMSQYYQMNNLEAVLHPYQSKEMPDTIAGRTNQSIPPPSVPRLSSLSQPKSGSFQFRLSHRGNKSTSKWRILDIYTAANIL